MCLHTVCAMIEIVVVHFNSGEYMRKDHTGCPEGKAWVLPTDVKPIDLLISNLDALELSFDQGTYERAWVTCYAARSNPVSANEAHSQYHSSVVRK